MSSTLLGCPQDADGFVLNVNKKEATVNYYIVRVYRKKAAADPQASGLTGMVETQAGVQHAFHTAQELWRILQRDCEDGDVFASSK